MYYRNVRKISCFERFLIFASSFRFTAFLLGQYLFGVKRRFNRYQIQDVLYAVCHFST